MADGLTIGQLARHIGIGVETVRYYERRGLIDEPPRRASGYRSYSPGTISRLRFIRRAKALGFSLGEVQELLGLSSRAVEPCAEVQAQIATKLADVRERIADLERMRAALARLLDACEETGENGRCPVLEALASEESE